MKTIPCFSLIFGFLLIINHRVEAAPPTDKTVALPSTAFSIVNRGAHSRVWERTTYEQDPSGKILPQIHRYTELATGLNYWDAKTGQWVESKEEIAILPNGTAAAIQGQHQAYFPGNIYQGVIEVVTPDGQHLKSRPLGLSYDDGTKTVLIAELKDSVGQVVGANQVIYPDAFTDFKADLRYTYTKAGFEQDIVLREQPPAPESFGLDSQNTRLQVLTEFFDTPEPARKANPVSKADRLSDTTLTFGKMKITQGKAFAIGDSAQASSHSQKIPVYKSWQRLEGRTFLVEEVPVRRMETQLEQLPVPANAGASSVKSSLCKVSTRRLLTPVRLVQNNTSAMQLAREDFNQKPGVVLDYDEIDYGETNDFTFQGDTTYYISAEGFYVSGTTTFEGGTVIKLNGAATTELDLETVVCKTGPYHPAVITEKNDNSVGETIDGSSGNPGYAYCVFLLNPSFIHDVRITYINYGWGAFADTIFENVQVGYCGTPIWALGDESQTITVNNGLFWNIYDMGLDCALIGNHLTVANCASFTSGAGIPLCLTNCLLVCVTNFATSGEAVATNAVVLTNAANVFQTVGGGSYYLATNSPYRNAGTTNIDPTVLADIATKTTYPPIMLTNDITVATTLSPQAQRDTNTPDIGYHYDPIDYMWTNLVMTENVTLTNGAAVSFYRLMIADAMLTSWGTANRMNHICPRSCVQEREQSSGSMFRTIYGGINANFNFTSMSSLGEQSIWKCQCPWSVTIQNSAFQNINLFIGLGGAAVADSPDTLPTNQLPVLIKNNVFERCSLSAESASYFYDYYPGNVPDYYEFEYQLSAQFYNNLFWHSSVGVVGWLYYWGDIDSFDFSFYNNAFDNTSTSLDGWWMDYANNADIGTSSSGVSSIYLSTFNYATGPLGPWYQASTDLIDEGTTNANYLGLYWFTTQTNQVPETNSIVDIGFHYAVLDTNGLPLVFMFGVLQLGNVNDSGTIFELTPGGYEADIHSFAGPPDGRYPVGDLVLSGSTLYGVTERGGSNSYYGTIFKINTDGSDYAILYSFTGGNDGALPEAGLTLSGNTLYGTTLQGGALGAEGVAAGIGTIFKINTDGSGFTNIYTFGLTNYEDGFYPDAPLLLVSNTLYGTTDLGTIFRINTDGSGFTNIYYFDDSAYYNPRGRLVLVSNTLYGVTILGGNDNGNDGIIYSINTNGSNYQVVHYFNAFDGDGKNPRAGLLLVSNTIYGTTVEGGANPGPYLWGDGTVFSFVVGNAAGTYKVLQSLTDNIYQEDSSPGLLLLRGNLLYGMTGGGFYNLGFVFSLSLNGTNFTDIYDVGTNPNDGVYPIGGLCSP